MTDPTDSPACEPMFDAGLYVFLLRLRELHTLDVGALGAHPFPPGWYLYVGSAQKNLASRVERHWSLKKKIHWHIDHLSTAPDSEPVGAVVIPAEAGLSECDLNREIGRLFGNQFVVPGFGASDCTAGCPAHLWFSGPPVSLLAVARVHPAAAVLIPGAGVWEPSPQNLAALESDPED